MANYAGSPASPAGDRVEEPDDSLEKIKKQLTSASGRTLLQGPILKRSETLRKWNERWVTLDPTTGKMEYRARRNELAPKGTIIFDASSTITVSPVNFHGLPKYDGCCFYIGTPQKKEYFLCCETPGAARAWVATLRASQLVLKAHREAVNSLSGNGSTKLGTVAAVVAAANSTARESAKEIGVAMQISMKAALGAVTNQANDGRMDDLTIMKETLRVKDEELHQLARELRARDSTIKEIADKLSETAEAAESAASAAHAMDKERKAAMAEIERLSREMDDRLRSVSLKLRASDDKLALLTKERDHLMKQRDAALQEAQLWRAELAKARERAVIMEAAVVRADERAKLSVADAEAKVKEATEKEMAALNAKEEVLKEMQKFQAQFKRPHSDVQTPEHIRDGQIQTCIWADSGCPVETSETCNKNATDGTHFSGTATSSITADSGYVTPDDTNIQVLDQSAQGISQPTCAANPNERDLVPETECGHLGTPCLVSSVTPNQVVGSPGRYTLPLNPEDANPAAMIQHIYLSTDESNGL